MRPFASKTIAGLYAALLALAWPSAADGLNEAHQLRSVQVRPGVTGPIVRIEVDGTAPYRMSHDASMTTLRLDLADTRIAPDYQRLLIDAAKVVQSVEARQSSDTPQSLAQVDLRLAKPHTFSVRESQGLVIELVPVASSAEIAAFTEGSREIRLAENRAMARSYVMAVARSVAADTAGLFQTAQNAVNEARQYLVQARSADLAAELAADASVPSRAADIRAIEERIAKAHTEVQSLDAKRNYLTQTAAQDIESADAAAIAGRLAQYEQSIKTVAGRIKHVSAALAQDLERARMLAAAFTQRNAVLRPTRSTPKPAWRCSTAS
jgi:hypothetical protein